MPDPTKAQHSWHGVLAWRDELASDDTEQTRALLSAAQHVDGGPEINSAGQLPREFRGGRHLLALDDAELVGYAHIDTVGDAFGRPVAELLVHPDHRRHGIGQALLSQLLDQAKPDVRIWSHHDHPGAARLAKKYQ